VWENGFYWRYCFCVHLLFARKHARSNVVWQELRQQVRENFSCAVWKREWGRPNTRCRFQGGNWGIALWSLKWLGFGEGFWIAADSAQGTLRPTGDFVPRLGSGIRVDFRDRVLLPRRGENASQLDQKNLEPRLIFPGSRQIFEGAKFFVVKEIVTVLT
jgi:hypothetical protein